MSPSVRSTGFPGRCAYRRRDLTLLLITLVGSRVRFDVRSSGPRYRAAAALGGNRYVLVPGHEVGHHPLRPAGRPEALEPAEQFLEQDLDRDPGDAVPNAVMRADPERQVLVRLAADVERRSGGELLVV